MFIKWDLFSQARISVDWPSDYKSTDINKLEKYVWRTARTDDTCQTVVVIYCFVVSIILWVTLYHPRRTTKLLLRPLFLSFFLAAACLVDGICGKKRRTATWIYQARHSCRKPPSDGRRCFLFILSKNASQQTSFQILYLKEGWNVFAGGSRVREFPTGLAERSNSNGSFIMSSMSRKM